MNQSLSFYRSAAIFSVAAFLLLGVSFLQPFSFDENANAETATSSASMDMSVTLDPAITIWTTDTSDVASSQVDISADPDESVVTGSIRAHVSTNNLTGYTLTIQSNSTDAKMKHENASVTKTIDPITGSGTSASSWASSSNLNNMWGYSIGANDSFVGVPGSSSSAATIDSTDAPNSDNSTDITFATKADLSLPAGTYTDTVIFSAVANATPVEYMQDADASWCASLDIYDPANSEATTYTLKDKRDNSSYTIRKLADGNCWMVNNLKLSAETLNANTSRATPRTTLTPSDTDLPSGTDFDVPATDNADWGGYSYAIAAKIANSNNANYGMYYNWWAAVASTNNPTTQYQNVTTSICPKGWDLPRGQGASTYSTNNDWYKLLVTGYGLKDYTETSSTTGNPTSFTGTAYELPFSGYWHYSGTSPQAQGSSGSWWSSTVTDTDNAYLAYVNNNGRVRAGTDNYNKRRGYSVRCMLFPSA